MRDHAPASTTGVPAGASTAPPGTASSCWPIWMWRKSPETLGCASGGSAIARSPTDPEVNVASDAELRRITPVMRGRRSADQSAASLNNCDRSAGRRLKARYSAFSAPLSSFFCAASMASE